MDMRPVYRLSWWMFRALFRCYFRWRVYGADHVPATGPAIFASNHASFLDPPLVGSSAHRAVHFMARESLFRFPGIASLLRSWNAVPVDRDGGGATGLMRVINRLEAGGAVLLFPEGTRTRDGQLQPARSGIGLLVIKTDAPVIPIRVFGTFEAMGRHAVLPRPHRVMIAYGQPLLFRELRAEAKNCDKPRLKQIYAQVARDIMAAIAALEPAELSREGSSSELRVFTRP
jgi:1-acyl-sn-glycerol-3-phosphate acyltransferase